MNLGKTVQVLFLTWWLFSGGAGFVAFLCAKGFWRDYRQRKAEGRDTTFAFWTAFLFSCFAAEAALTVVLSPLTASDNLEVAALGVAILRRTLQSAGMWLWWLKVVK